MLNVCVLEADGELRCRVYSILDKIKPKNCRVFDLPLAYDDGAQAFNKVGARDFDKINISAFTLDDLLNEQIKSEDQLSLYHYNMYL